LPVISLNGVQLDEGVKDDPLTLFTWEDETGGKRRKRDTEEEFTSKHCDKTAAVDANGTKIVLCLNRVDFANEDSLIRNYDNLTVTVYGPNTTRTRIELKSLRLEYVVGWVIGEVFSSVSGFILDSNFYGSIFVNHDIYYVDPSKNSLPLDHQASLYDRGSDKELPKAPLAPSMVEPVPVVGSPPLHPMPPTRRRRSAEKEGRRVCSLALVADHIFHQEVGGGDVAATVLQMLFHVREANAVFLTKDFDNNNKSDCIGFQVEAITILETEKSYVNILLGNYDVPEDFLRKFSRYNFAQYCLGLLFTNRLFKDLVLGLSWRGNPRPGGVGGTCQQRARYREDGKTYSFNALFISMRSRQQSRIPLRMAILNLVHELMHAFGAKHDPEERKDCTPKDVETNGRFLMSKYSNNGRKHNHEVLSPCTKESVVQCLASEDRTRCMKPVDSAYCGNGLVEEGEECDCGDEFQCLTARSCCPPPTGGEDLQPCRLRSPCAIGENVVGANEVGANEVKADRIEEEAKEENMTAEKVIEEEKKYVKSTRLCQFFNIC